MDDLNNIFNFYRRYKWTAEDFTDLQETLLTLPRNTIDGLTGAAIFEGFTITANSVNMTLTTASGVAVSPTGYLCVKNISTASDIEEVSGPSGLIRKDLVVIRPLETQNTEITNPSNAFEQVNLKTRLQCELVVLEGSESTEPEYPSIGENDVVLCGLRVQGGQTALTPNDVDYSVRDILGKNSILKKTSQRFDDRLMPYKLDRTTVNIKPSQLEAPYPRMFSYASDTPSIFPKNSLGQYQSFDTSVNLQTGEISGGDQVSPDFSPVIPGSGNFVVACISLTPEDELVVTYGEEGTRTECLDGITNQLEEGPGSVLIEGGTKPLAFCVVGSYNSEDISELELIDARSTGGGGGSAGFKISQYTLKTNNDAPTSIASIPVQSGRVMSVISKITCKRTGGGGNEADSAFYTLKAKVKNVSGTLDISTTVAEEFEDVPEWDARFILSGQNLIIQVVGGAGVDIEWRAAVETQSF
jgi:hypothetical protein